MKKYIVFALACFFSTNIQAQENLNNEVIDVVKNFRPKIMKAHKIKSQPLFVDTTKVSEDLKYLIRFEEFRIAQNVDSLTARVLKRIPVEYLFTKHVELGMGSKINPHLSLDLSNGKSTKSIFQAYLNYDASFSEITNSQDKFSYLSVGGAYKRVFKSLIMQSNLLLDDRFRFDFINTSYRNSSIDLNTAIQFTDTLAAFIPKELNVSSELFFRNTDFTEFAISASSSHLGVFKDTRTWALQNDFSFLQTSNLNTFHWKSDFSTVRNSERSLVTAGLKSDLLQNSFKLFPVIRAQYELIKKGLFAYAEVGGDRHLYNLSRVYGDNPFTDQSSIITNNTLPSNTSYFTRVGVNGNLFRGVSYQLSVEANIQDGFMHFVQALNYNVNTYTSLIPQFTEVKMVKLNAQVDAKWTDKFHVWLKGEYKSFDQYLSHIPELEIGLYGDYHYNDQWFLTSSVRYTGARSYLVIGDETNDMLSSPFKVNPMIDINCKVNFAYNKQIGFYVEGVNLLNQNYDFWQHELLIGRCINFGAKYRF